MSFDKVTLPDTPEDLKEIIIDLYKQVAAQQAAHDKETDILLEQIRLLRAQLYGRKTEKIPLVNGPQPLPLFDMPEPDDITGEEEEVLVPSHIRKKRGRKSLPEELP